MTKKNLVRISMIALALIFMTSCVGLRFYNLGIRINDMSTNDICTDGWVVGTDTIIDHGVLASFALFSDGNLWGWGWNFHGQLGDGTTIDRHRPIWIMDDVIYVSGGGNHTVVIKTDGSLWAWGRNQHGQLGDGTTENRLYPVHIMDDVIAVSAGAGHTVAIRTDGSLWSWGLNYHGEVGDGTTEDRLYPVHIMDDVEAVFTGMGHTMAITNGGSLWGWGLNIEGQIGNGTTENRLYPVHIMDDVVYVSGGQCHTMAIRTDGSLWGWGGGGVEVGAEHNFGQIGDGEKITRHNPVWVMGDVIHVSAGAGHTMAITANGSLWGWGLNSRGEIGDSAPIGRGADFNRPNPIRILDDVVSVSAGFYHNLAITSDGSLWAWGWNGHGQLGDGTTQTRNVPVRVMPPMQ